VDLLKLREHQLLLADKLRELWKELEMIQLYDFIVRLNFSHCELKPVSLQEIFDHFAQEFAEDFSKLIV
jgi:hypothetical protein